jgi:ribosomal protein L23
VRDSRLLTNLSLSRHITASLELNPRLALEARDNARPLETTLCSLCTRYGVRVELLVAPVVLGLKGLEFAPLPVLVIGEKASESASKNCYVFDIHLDATKRDVVSAIRSAYKVTPVRVNVTYIRAKNVVTRRGQRGVKQGGKKAYVYLKKDDTITLM